MDLQDAIRELAAKEAPLRERRLPAHALRVEQDTLVAGDARYRLPTHGFERLCRRLGAPAAYLTSLDGPVRSAVLQHHLDRGDLEDEAVTIISRADDFLAFGRPDLLRLTSDEVVEAVRDGVDRDLAVHDLHFLGDDSVQLDLLGLNVSEEVAPGDVIRAGLRISHSIVGEQATRIEAFMLRLVCTNGMTHRDCVASRATRTRRLPANLVHARDLQIDQMRRLAASTWAALDRKLRSIGASRQERVDVDGLLEGWIRRAHLPARRLMPLLLEAWQEEGGEPTAYGVINALTRVATHATQLPAPQRRALSGLAGLLAFRRSHLCPRCFSMLGSTCTPDAAAAERN